MFVFVMILLLLAAVFGVLGAVLKAVVFLVITTVLAWWAFKRKAREIHADYDRQIAQQRVARYRVNEASREPQNLPPRDDRY